MKVSVYNLEGSRYGTDVYEIPDRLDQEIMEFLESHICEYVYVRSSHRYVFQFTPKGVGCVVDQEYVSYQLDRKKDIWNQFNTRDGFPLMDVIDAYKNSFVES